MVYVLVDTLQTDILQIEDKLATLGQFSYLPKDLLFKITSYLDLWTTGKLSLTTKGFYTLIEHPRVWEGLIRYYTSSSYTGTDCKQKFFKLYTIPRPVPTTYRYLFSIVEREGTGDPWPPDLHWTVAFSNEMQRIAKIKLVPKNEAYEGDIVNIADKVLIGKYKFETPLEVKRMYPPDDTLMTHSTTVCRFLGAIRGWFTFNTYSVSTEVLITSLMRICRGDLIDRKLNIRVPSIVYHPLWVRYEQDQNNKKIIKNIQFNRNFVPSHIDWITKPTTPCTYSRHLSNILSKQTPSKDNQIYYWVYHNFQLLFLQQQLNASLKWEKLNSADGEFWLNQMHRKKGDVV
eukprot:TRINITY_DN3617_c0_g1_i2.p1 TRINITY_DN3617_c0_g1~~TRINITY_DN3617_c0_g1_i2.p1  ORF type:complete len:345 (+),score=93.32 TRINITY_DN3617_c0_g1_i2:365-1399(+)